MLPQEEIDEQIELLQTYRRTLATYLRQQAAIGEAYSPPALVYGINETRGHIKRIKTALRGAGVEVPEDIDDDEPIFVPVVPRVPSRTGGHGIAIAVVVAAVLLVGTGLLVGRFGGLWSSNQTPDTSTGSVASAATAAPNTGGGQPQQNTPTAPSSAAGAPGANSPAQTLLAEYAFAGGTNQGWNGEAEYWQVVPIDGGFAYQGQAPAETNISATPPNVEGLRSLQNYAVEMRVKKIQAGPSQADVPDLWLSLRAEGDSSSDCDAYNFLFWQTDGSVSIHLAGTSCFQVLAEGQGALDLENWHTIRTEVNGTELKLYMDGTLAASATSDVLSRGFFYINVGPGATVQITDVRVYQL